MRLSKGVSGFVLFLLSVLVITASVSTMTGAVPLVEVFYSESCDHCDSIITELLKPAQKNYSGRLKVVYYEIENNAENYKLLNAKEEKLGKIGNELPVIFIDGTVMGGSERPRKELPALFEKIALKEPEQVKEDIPVKTDSVRLSDTTSSSVSKEGEIRDSVYLIYIYKHGCQSCERATYDMRLLASEYPTLSIKKFDVETEIGSAISEHLCFIANIPDEQHLGSPMIFIGDGFLLPDSINFRSITALVQAQGEKAYRDISDIPNDDLKKAKDRIRNRFSGFSIWVLITAGLVDGIIRVPLA